MTHKLNPRHEKFIEHYLAHGIGTQAAIAAGYSPKTARVQASTLLTYPNIAQRVADGLRAQVQEIKIDAAYVKNQAVILHRRAMLVDPVVNSQGEPIGEYQYDPTTAHKALKMIGDHKDVMAFDNTVKHIGDPDRPIGVQSLNATDRAARIADIFKQALVDHDKSKKS